MNINKIRCGTTDNNDIYLLELSNPDQLKVTVSNFGATITSLLVPDSKENIANVVLSYDTISEYFEDQFYLGCIVGRVAGRINKGGFSINDVRYQLAQNETGNGNHLHGGVTGFNKKVFEIAEMHCSSDAASVQLRYKSKDMEEGYPGNLEVGVTYTLTIDNELIISYNAKTDKPTHFNPTNHSYFNLSGKAESALHHELFINSEAYLEANEAYIPTGVIKAVKGTPYDFRSLRRIDKFLDNLPSPGYNEYFVLEHNGGPDAILFDRDSGRKMTISTTSPGLVFYTADYLEGKFQKCQGVCLETQFFPDTPNHPEFPGTLLQPGEEFNHHTRFKFTW